jgi:hypothetical protein
MVLVDERQLAAPPEIEWAVADADPDCVKTPFVL